eukprot:1522384-Rhodomonas_salina.1
MQCCRASSDFCGDKTCLAGIRDSTEVMVAGRKKETFSDSEDVRLTYAEARSEDVRLTFESACTRPCRSPVIRCEVKSQNISNFLKVMY